MKAEPSSCWKQVLREPLGLDQVASSLAMPAQTRYVRRALVENGIGRYKAIIGPRLRSLAAQQTEAVIGSVVLNHVPQAGWPHFVGVKAVAQRIRH